MSNLQARLRRIQIFLCDVDGVLTDGTVFIGGSQEIKRFNIQDGLGLVFLRRAGIKVGWVSNRPSKATKLRARELKIDFLVQQIDRHSKVGVVEEILGRAKLGWDAASFMGDDVVDLGPLQRAGLAVAVANAGREAKAAAHYVTRATGGHGAVREVAEMILKAQKKWNSIVAGYRV
ncbi:MAG TPA: HAD hydrolase family protein [Candidatus Saccharimonadales bacterium]|nr:HAD hydrolase family protein [Candidatus Saccharimonadales bacterium]